MKLRRKTKSGLSTKDRQWIKKKIEAKLSVETLERRELLAADIVGGLADIAEGEGDPKVQMRLVATDTQGQPLDTVVLNQDFHLQGYVTDLRSDAKGVFTSYMDVEFDKGLVQVIGAIEHSDTYRNFKSGAIDVSGTVGVIDEVGGMAGLSELGATEHLVFTVPLRATAAGTVVFDGNHADVKPAHQVLVYGENDEVAEDLITIVDYSLEVSDVGTLPYDEDFNDGTADAITVKQGSFSIENNRYNSTPANSNQRALAVIDLTVDIPSKTRFQSTINLEFAGGLKRNAYQVFAYQNNDNYKIAGLNAEANRWVVGEFVNGQYRELRRGNTNPVQNKNYQLELQIDGKAAKLHVDGQMVAAHTFTSDLNVGKFGLLAIGANSRFDDVHISEILPVPLAEGDFGETVIGQAVTIDVLANDEHEQNGTPLHIVSVDDVDNGTVELRDNNQDNKADVLVFTPAGGFSGSESFTYVVGDANGQTDSANVLVDVLPGIPMEEDFSTEQPTGFEVLAGNWKVVDETYVAQNRNGYSLAKIRTGVENPAETEFSAMVSMPRVNGYQSNVELVYDLADAGNYKFAGGSVDSQQWYLGEVVNGQRQIVKTQAATIARTEYELSLVIRGKNLEFSITDVEGMLHDTAMALTYDTAPNVGLFGLGANRSKAVVDDVKIREFVPAPVAEDDVSQTIVNTPVDITVLTNDGHETQGTFIYLDSVSGVENGTATLKDTNDDGKNDTITFTPANDFRGTTSFDYLVKDNNGQQDRGNVLITVAAALPLEVDFDDSTAVDFSYTDNKWRFNSGGFQSTDT
ncbi:MAG: Ig-like domain-containing protein, partial [Planctomycetota bacterium]|nr:Ig-like domain-containing protein [Planctomycetota bacterium]